MATSPQRIRVLQALRELTPDYINILLTCAYLMESVKLKTIEIISKKHKELRFIDVKHFFKKWQEEGLVSVKHKWYRHEEDAFILNPYLHSELLILLAQKTEKELHEYDFFIQENHSHSFTYESVQNVLINNRDAVIAYFRDQKQLPFEYFYDRYISYNTWLEIVHSWFDFEEYYPLIPLQRGAIIESLFQKKYLDATLNLKPFHPHDFDFYATENKRINQEDRNFMKERLLFPQYILQGNLSIIPNLVSGNYAPGLSALALYEQYRGNYEQAVKLYEKSIRMTVGTSFPGLIFYSYAYIIALIRLDTDKARSKLLSLSKKKELKENLSVFQPIIFLLQMETANDTESVRQSYARTECNGPELQQVLFCLLIKHYQIRELTDKEQQLMQKLVPLNYISLLKLELAERIEPFASEKSQLEKTTGLKPLLPTYEYVELWEKTLNTFLKEENAIDRKNATHETSKKSRIIYLVNRFGEITPKLQKSKDGVNWSKGRNIALLTFKWKPEELSPFDQEIAQMVSVTNTPNHYGYPVEEVYLGGASVLAKLAGYPLVYWEEDPSIPMDISIEKPYLSFLKKNNQYQVETNVTEPKHRNLISCHFETNTRIKVISMTSREKEILIAMTQVGSFPLAAEGKLKRLIGILNKDIIIHSDLLTSNNQIMQIEGDTHITLQLLPVGEGFKAEFFIKPFIDEPSYCKPGVGPHTAMGKQAGETCQAIRNFKLELQNFQVVKQALSDFEFIEPDVLMLNSPLECLEFLDIVQILEEVRVEWPEGVKLKIRNRVTERNFSITVKNKNNWFELSGSVRFDEETTLSLAKILEQLETNSQRFISLGKNEYAALSDELRKMLHSLKAMSVRNKNESLKISAFTAPALESFRQQGLTVNTDSVYNQLLKQIQKTTQEEYAIPAQLQTSLREYQEEGFRWMLRLSNWGAGACLADDMGLGKTIQAIALLLYKASQGASLIIAPASVLQNWQQEILRFAPSLTIKILNNETDRKSQVENAEDYDVVLTTYGILISTQEILWNKQWNVIVLDEAHVIKNKDTKMSKAAMALKGQFRLLLTGTPIQNHLSEIWNLFEFMNPGMLGSFDHFTANFIIPIETGGNKSRQQELKKLIAPFLLRRTKNDVLNELPGKTEIVIPVILNKSETIHYESLRRKAEMSLEENKLSAIQTLAEITKLRQAASHMGLVRNDYKGESSKMEAFFDLLDEIICNNHRALVFSQFTAHLALFKKALDKRGIEYLYLDGSTPTSERGNLVKKFQTGTQPIFLVSLKAGGLGLNLTAADFIVHLDPWWNPAIEDQASDRAYRIGQTRPVTVYRLITTNTIEEKILQLHQTKKALADSLLEGTDTSHKLSREDLLALLRKI